MNNGADQEQERKRLDEVYGKWMEKWFEDFFLLALGKRHFDNVLSF